MISPLPHPIAEYFPLITGEEFQAMVASIKENGLRKPITLYEGQILDGRNRHRACVEAGVKPRFDELPPETDPWRFVWDENAIRRDLPAGQKAAIRIKFNKGSDEWHASRKSEKDRANRQRSERSEGNQSAKKKDDSSDSKRSVQTSAPTVQTHKKRSTGAEENKTRHTVAKQAGVSHDTAQKAMTLEQKSPELFEKVAAGEITLNQAVKSVKQAEAKAEVAKQAQQAPERAYVQLADALKFLGALEPNSVDLLLTDPPYSTDVDDIGQFAQSWVPLALSRIKLTGRAYICTGAYPNELNAYLNVLLAQTRLVVSNVMVWTYRNTLGPAPKTDYKNNWQAIFHIRGPEASALDCPVMVEQFSVQDINAPDGRLGDRYHAWQKPDELAERLVRHSTKPGDLVVDPFACTGTFLLAAAKLGRKATGCDISEENLAIAIERGCARAA